MNTTPQKTEVPTRRDTIKGGGALIGGGLLAGCTGRSEPSGGADNSNESGSGNATNDGGGNSYSVTMSPMGRVEFEAVPESAAVYDANWADTLVALGQQNRINSLGFPDRYYTGYYDQLPGVSFDTSGLTKLWTGSLDKEVFYELNSDVHHMDPIRWAQSNGWDMNDVQETIENVGPWFANRFSRTNTAPPNCLEYEFYTIWGLADKFSQVYQVENRSSRLKQVRDEMLAEIQPQLPPQANRPSVGLLVYSDETFGIYDLVKSGFGSAHYRPLEPVDAFAESDQTYSASDVSLDIEGLLEFDPDIIIHNWDIEPSERYKAMLEYFETNPVAQQLTAAQNDRVYVGGSPLQGPIYNIFQIEMAAKQIYPDQFGEWQGVGKNPEDERLFDRQRVANIVTGGA